MTDAQGRRAFALVNVATGKALVHARGKLQLAPYAGHDGVEISKLWSLGVKFDDGFCEVRDLCNMDSTINVTGGMGVDLVRYHKSENLRFYRLEDCSHHQRVIHAGFLYL